MKKTVLTFGLISGAISAGMMPRFPSLTGLVSIRAKSSVTPRS